MRRAVQSTNFRRLLLFASLLMLKSPFVPASHLPPAAVSARTGTPMQTVYGATKASLEHFARVWSKELGHSHGTTVNCLNPGALDVSRRRLDHLQRN